jgi:cytochrome c oxidase subunit IV
MSAATEHHNVEPAVAAHDGHHTPSDQHFIKVALFLAALTAAETATYWVDLGAFATPALIIMMSIKFWIIIRVFMHLKYDSKLFGAMFYIGLGLAVFVYFVYLSTFQFFAR